MSEFVWRDGAAGPPPRPERDEGSVASVVACALPQLVELASTASGRIAQVHVRVGDVLQRGQELLTIAPERGARGGGRGRDDPAGPLPRVTLRSAMGAVVVRRWVGPGEDVARGERILSLARAAPVHVLAVFEPGAVPDLPVGSAAVVRVRSLPGCVLRGRVLGPGLARGVPGTPESIPGGSTRVLLQVDGFPPGALCEGRARLEVLLPRSALTEAALLARPPCA